MGWQDRDYHRDRRDDKVDDDPYDPDEVAESSYDPDVEDNEDVDDDPETPGTADVGRDGDEPAFVACPNCRRMISEDAEQCPKCGYYVLDEELSQRGRPVWVWVGLVLALLVVVLWAIG